MPYDDIPSLDCVSGPLPDTLPAWGNSASSAIYYGDSFFGSIVGKEADARYYTRGLREANMIDLMFSRRNWSVPNCLSRLDLLLCDVCEDGYFFASASECKPCDSCCFTCTGDGNTGCGSCASNCYLSGPNTCIRCPAGCSTCSSTVQAIICDSCLAGYYIQPYGLGVCLQTCPSGFSPSGTTCLQTNSIIFEAILDQIAPTISIFTGQSLLNGNTMTYYPPSFEPTDPLPSQHRGYYFPGSAYITLPPAPSTAGSALMFPATFSFSAWLWPLGSGLRTIYSKHAGCDYVLTVSLTAANYLLIQSPDTSVSFTYLSAALIPDQWVFLAFSCEYQSASQSTSIRIWLDGVVDATIYALNARYVDNNPTLRQYIGADEGISSFYQGYIWKISIFNYKTVGFGGEIQSPRCPTGLGFCLSQYSLLQTITGANCAPECVNGCTRPSDCSLCADYLCLFCSYFDTFACSQCVPTVSLDITCHCPQGYYSNPSSQTCAPCSSLCVTCSPDAFTCQQCSDNAVLDASNRCICAISYYFDADLSSCVTCGSLCEVCSSSAVCTSCSSNAQLTGGICECSAGYYPSQERCKACLQGCIVCVTDTCIGCLSGFFLLESACVLTCPASFLSNIESRTCQLYPNPSLTISANVDSANNILLSFSQRAFPRLQLSNLALSLTDSAAFSYNFTAILAEIASNQLYNLSTTLREDYLPADNLFRIVFLSPESFRDENGNYLLNSSVNVSLNAVERDTATHSINTTKEMRTVAVASVVGALAISALSGNPTLLLALINNVQMLTYLPLSTVPMPADLRNSLKNVNLLEAVPSPLPEIGNMQDSPDFASDYGYSSTAFLVNAGAILALFSLNLGSWLAIWLFSRLQSLKTPFGAVLKGYKWRNIGMHVIVGYLDLAVPAFLQVYKVKTTQLSFSSIWLSVSSISGILAAILCVIFPFTLLFLCIRDHFFVKSHTFEPIQAHAYLYIILKNDKGWLSSAYYSLFLFRRLLYSLALIFLSDFPLIQSLIFAFHSTFVRNLYRL